jgi:hypothetical protein
MTTARRLDGYCANAAIKLLLPPPLLRIESGLRVAGFGRKLDELVLGMNRAQRGSSLSFTGRLRRFHF